VRIRGICYDAGVEQNLNWRPGFDPRLARREMQIIHDDLH
jgi:hypothetical protein